MASLVSRHRGMIGYLILCLALFIGAFRLEHEQNARVRSVAAESKARSDALAAEAAARAEIFLKSCRELRIANRDAFVGIVTDFVHNETARAALIERFREDFDPDDCDRAAGRI